MKYSFSIRLWLSIGAFFGMLAFILSALTSHLPDLYFAHNGRNIARIANNVLTIQSLALIMISILQKLWKPNIHFNIVGFGFALGALIFVTSVYYTAMTGNHPAIPLAPMGGSTLILAWLYLAISAFLIKDKP